jgi:hypothetical protein
MAIRFFWMYIGSFLACAVVLVMTVKQFSPDFGGNAKKPVIFSGLSAILASGAAYLATVIDKHLFVVFWFLTGIFLLFGIIHVLFIHKKYFSSNKHNESKMFMGELIFALSIIFFTIVIFSSLQYFLKDPNFLFYPMLTSTLAFFIPVTVLHAFEAAYRIPDPVFSTWEYPLNDPIDLPDEKPNEKLLVIAFEIAKKPTDDIPINFRAKGPDNMKLGDLYYHFLNDYNELHSETPISYTVNDYESQRWWFRVKPGWFQANRILDPELSIRENKIKENNIIVCERIPSVEE